MSWFQLDPASAADRARAEGKTAAIPSLGASLRRGILGFTAVSVAGFAPWVFLGHWFHRHIGEAGLYAVCALLFIGLSGLLLHRLIIGPGSLGRFYALFGIAFAGYSVAWIVGWMTLRGHVGSLAGLLAGAVVMGGIFANAFEARRAAWKVIAALFVLNAAGYFVGGWFEGMLMSIKEFTVLGIVLPKAFLVAVAKLQWGVCYGIGLGAGLGLAFYICQAKTRELLDVKPQAA
jgi:hypothetical protein